MHIMAALQPFNKSTWSPLCRANSVETSAVTEVSGNHGPMRRSVKSLAGPAPGGRDGRSAGSAEAIGKRTPTGALAENDPMTRRVTARIVA